MANGKWQMANGKWQMANGKESVAKCQIVRFQWHRLQRYPTKFSSTNREMNIQHPIPAAFTGSYVHKGDSVALNSQLSEIIFAQARFPHSLPAAS
jgi:hypothetical protein